MLETPVFSTAAVAAPHARAAEIGQSILASGGNAVEAVVAMAATCAVVLPHLNGLGGDGFFLVREPRGRVHALDASGPAGMLATIERYRKREYEIIPAYGPDAALTIAGVAAGWRWPRSRPRPRRAIASRHLDGGRHPVGSRGLRDRAVGGPRSHRSHLAGRPAFRRDFPRRRQISASRHRPPPAEACRHAGAPVTRGSGGFLSRRCGA